jgi:hypothetical protein
MNFGNGKQPLTRKMREKVSNEFEEKYVSSISNNF